jgi:hypothetical protein
MLQRVRDFFNAYLLIELWQGLRVTLTNMFGRRSPFSSRGKRRR